MKKQKAAEKSAASKPVLCPQHHLTLEVSAQDMEVFGKAFHVLVGHCPKCRDLYISQAVIPASRVFSVGGKRYQLLPELNNTPEKRNALAQAPSTVSVPVKKAHGGNDLDDIESFFLAAEDQVLQEVEEAHIAAAKAKRERERQLKLQREAEEKLRREELARQAAEQREAERRAELQRKADEEIRKRQAAEQAKRKAAEKAEQNRLKRIAQEARQKQIQEEHRKQAAAAEERKKRHEREQAERKEQTIEETRKRIQSNKYRLYHVHDYIGNCKRTDKCPADNEPLIFVERVEVSVGNTSFYTKGYCCLRCNRLIVSSPDLVGAQPKTAQKPVIENTQPKPTIIPPSSGLKPQELKREASFDNGSSTLFICKGTVACHRKGHEIESVTGVMENLRGLPVRININYCHQCKQYFIDYAEYSHYRKLYGAILGNFKVTTGSTFSSLSFETMAEESALKLCGYTVNQTDDMSAIQRHTILSYLMEHHIMDKADILSHLNFFIRTNGKRKNMVVAVSRWEDDIAWVRSYRLGEQRQARIRDVQKYRK